MKTVDMYHSYLTNVLKERNFITEKEGKITQHSSETVRH